MTGRTTSSLRTAIRSHDPARGKRYEPSLKGRIIEYARSRREEGTSWARIAEEIDFSFETLRRWCHPTAPKTSGAMVPVRVVVEGRERTVSVTSVAGYRIEDLTLHEAVAVLRALG